MTTKLHQAVIQGDYKKFKEILQKGNIPINSRTTAGKTPLYFAAERGNRKMVHDLLKRGANPNIKSSNMKNAPIHRAAEYGYTNIVRMLIQAGANINPTNAYGNVPIQKIVYPGHNIPRRNTLIRLLVRAGARVPRHVLWNTNNITVQNALRNALNKRNNARNAWSEAVERWRAARPKRMLKKAATNLGSMSLRTEGRLPNLPQNAIRHVSRFL